MALDFQLSGLDIGKTEGQKRLDFELADLTTIDTSPVIPTVPEPDLDPVVPTVAEGLTQFQVPTEKEKLESLIQSAQEATPEANVQTEYEAPVIETGPKNIVTKVKEVISNPLQIVPFVSSVQQIDEMVGLIGAAQRLEDDTADLIDIELLKEYVRESERDQTFGYKVGEVVTGMIPFALELAATSGIYTGGKALALKGGQKLLKKIVTKKAKSKIVQKSLELGLKATAAFVGATAQTLPAGSLRIAEGTLERMMPEIQEQDEELLITKDGEDVLPALAKAGVDTWIEMVSERTGGAFEEIIKPAKKALGNKAIKSALLKQIMKLNPLKQSDDIKRLVDKVGYNGILGEIFEERVGELARGAVYEAGLEDPTFKYQLPTAEQLAVELVSFSVPAIGAGIASGVQESRKKVKQQVEDELSFARQEGDARKVYQLEKEKESLAKEELKEQQDAEQQVIKEQEDARKEQETQAKEAVKPEKKAPKKKEEISAEIAKGVSLQVFKNPTAEQQKTLFDIARGKGVMAGEPKIRTTYDQNGNRYEWAATDAIHSTVEGWLLDNRGVLANQNKDFDIAYGRLGEEEISKLSSDDLIKLEDQGVIKPEKPTIPIDQEAQAELPTAKELEAGEAEDAGLGSPEQIKESEDAAREIIEEQGITSGQELYDAISKDGNEFKVWMLGGLANKETEESKKTRFASIIKKLDEFVGKPAQAPKKPAIELEPLVTPKPREDIKTDFTTMSGVIKETIEAGAMKPRDIKRAVTIAGKKEGLSGTKINLELNKLLKLNDAQVQKEAEVKKPEPVKEGTKEAIKYFKGKDLDESQVYDVIEKSRTLADEVAEGGLTDKQAYKSIVAAGIEGGDPSMIRVLGSNSKKLAKNIKKDVIKIWGGADVSTVVEEHTEAYYKNSEAKDKKWDSKVTKWRGEYETATGEKSSQSNLEWFSDRAIDYSVHGNIAQKIGKRLKNIFSRFEAYAKEVLKRAGRMRKYIKAGKVNTELIEQLDLATFGEVKKGKGKGKGEPSFQLRDKHLKEASKFDTPGDYLKNKARISREERRELLRDYKKRTGYEEVGSSIERGQGIHSPSGPEDGSPLYDVSDNGIYPEDIYSMNGLRYYSTGEDRLDGQAHDKILSFEGSPNKLIKVYRSVEKDGAKKIIPGDWVTTVRGYAKEHGDANIQEGYKILSKEVHARDIYTSGDSWLEWGYHPQEKVDNIKMFRDIWSEAHEDAPTFQVRQAPATDSKEFKTWFGLALQGRRLLEKELRHCPFTYLLINHLS